ncbi:hypothetical protein [Paraburkholderia sp. RL17-337-BIB-A]|uniref:hypothetical protein n=1 Tax=Paraburkholderia sp. RL17-337-BIB-A TaxID=3031636 RepID=UPI0038B780D9
MGGASATFTVAATGVRKYFTGATTFIRSSAGDTYIRRRSMPSMAPTDIRETLVFSSNGMPEARPAKIVRQDPTLPRTIKHITLIRAVKLSLSSASLSATPPPNIQACDVTPSQASKREALGFCPDHKSTERNRFEWFW